MLSTLKLINPKSYKESDNFEKYISLAPFGMDSIDPDSKTDVVSDKFPQIKKTDKIIYWGGGIWDWFDPISVIKAVESISETRNDVKLVFVGVKHPNPKIKAMQMATEALDYCKKNNLLDKCVFFNFGWTPYVEIKDYLKRSFIGISAHNNNLETRFSFRTRVLDYFWADLPIISTEGDSMADLVLKNKLGVVVGYNNPKEIKDAIVKLINDPAIYKECQNNIKKVKADFYWDNICAGFSKKIIEGEIEKRPFPLFKFIGLTFGFYYTGFKKKLFK
jgi:glycosyltransferase involved in cell wall biosynthesis